MPIQTAKEKLAEWGGIFSRHESVADERGVLCLRLGKRLHKLAETDWKG